MFLPLVMRPLSTGLVVGHADLRRIAEAPVSIVRGPPGSYLSEGLAAAILGWGRWQDCVWLRPLDVQPAALAVAVASACLHRWSDRDPTGSDNPRDGDPADGNRLDDIIRTGPRDAVVVLELGGRLDHGVARLIDALRPGLTRRGISLVAVTETRYPPTLWPGGRPVLAAADLMAERATPSGAALDRQRRDRLTRLAGRRTAVVHDILDAADVWPADVVISAVDAVSAPRALLDQVTGHLLDRSDPLQRAALASCLSSGYWHPSLETFDVPLSTLRPWVVPMEDQWGWLRPIWAGALRRQLAGRELHPARAAPAPVTAAGSPVVRPSPRTAVVDVRLLGPLEVRVDGVTVDDWRGTRGRSVLRYLVARRRHACARDELLAEFWPDVATAAARNRLQVAVSGLRRALARASSTNVIEYVDGEYRINPRVRVVVDVEHFEQRLAAARTADRVGHREQAASACREAMRLYRGDFAADAPYEQWTLLPRESLRIAFVDLLDRLSRIEYEAQRFDQCIAIAHRMLDLDPCREDAHRLLMRCYGEEGRIYAAQRQYDLCDRVLRATLQVGPTRETTLLYSAIRAGSLTGPARIANA